MSYNTKYGNPGRYNSTLPTVPDGEGAALAVDENGRLITVGGGTGSATTVEGTSADNTASTGNPILVGAEYNASDPTYDDGDATTLQADVNGNLEVREQYAPGYEDNTANRALVEQRNTHENINSNTTTTIVDGSGFLHSITINTLGASSNTATVYDNTAGSGTVIAVIDTTAGDGKVYDVTFATGLTVVTATGTAADLTVSYRAD